MGYWSGHQQITYFGTALTVIDVILQYVMAFLQHTLPQGPRTPEHSTDTVSRPCPTPGLIWSLRSHRSSTAQLWSLTTYSGRARADNLPLSTTLGLCSIRLLPHLAVYPALT